MSTVQESIVSAAKRRQVVNRGDHLPNDGIKVLRVLSSLSGGKQIFRPLRQGGYFNFIVAGLHHNDLLKGIVP